MRINFQKLMEIVLPRKGSESGGDKPTVTSKYGERLDRDGENDYHPAIDFNYEGGFTVNSHKPPVYSPVCGTLYVKAGSPWNTVSIEDDEGNIHSFLHMVDVSTKLDGMRVKIGDHIGYMGSAHDELATLPPEDIALAEPCHGFA